MTGGVSVLGGALRPRREGAWGSMHPSFRVCTVSSVSCPVSRMPCAHRVLPLHQRRVPVPEPCLRTHGREHPCAGHSVGAQERSQSVLTSDPGVRGLSSVYQATRIARLSHRKPVYVNN